MELKEMMKLTEISILELDPDERFALYDMVLNANVDDMPSETKQFRERILHILRK